MRSGQSTVSGAKPGVWVRKALSLLMAVCMAASLCPATALATEAAVDEELNASEPQETTVTEGGAEQASTVVSVSTFSSFHCVSSLGPTGTITVAASKQENTDGGRLTARFEGARPYQTGATVGGEQVNYPHYVMELTWTKNGRANDAYKITRALKASASASAYDVDCSLNSIFGEADREGTYVFTMTLVGENDNRATGTTFAKFTISDSTFTKDLITNEGFTPYTEVRGSFDDAAVLNVTDITSATEGSNAATLDMLKNQAGEKGIAEAWSMEIVNGSYLPAPTLYHSATQVTIDLADATRDELLALAQGESFTIVSLVKGETHSVTFTKGTTEDGRTVFTSTTTDGDGVPLEAILTVPENGNATLSFATAGLGGTLGAFGLAFASSAGSYKVQVNAQNGTVSPDGQIVRPVGSDAAFTLSPLGGYLLDDPTITVSPAGAQYVLDGNVLTVKSGAAGSTITVNVTFKEAPAVDPDDPAQPGFFDMSIMGYCAPENATAGDPVADSIIQATYTQVDSEGLASSVTSDGSQLTLGNVQAGTPVLLNFKVVADGYVVRGVRMAKTASALGNAPLLRVTGTTFSISAMTEDTQVVQVEYEPGVQPPTLDITHTVTGLAGENGAVSGSTEPGVTHGNYFVSNVRANSEYVIDHVWVFPGTLTTVPADAAGALADLTSAAQGKKTYDVNLTSVTADLTVVATFKRGPVSLNIVQTPGGMLTLSGAAGEPPYEIEAGNATFAFTVQDGYTFDGVLVGGQKKSVADLGVTAGAASGTFTLLINASTTVTPVFVPSEMPDLTKYLYATVVSDGNGVVNPEGGVTIAQGSTLTLNFGTVEGKESWRAAQVTVSAGDVSRSVTLGEGDWGSYVFDPSATPWNQLPTSSLYVISVSFEDRATGGQPDPTPLPKQAHIQMSTTEGGRISPAGMLVDGQYTYDVMADARQTFALIPDEGYHVDKVWMNVDASGAVADRMRDVTNASVNGTPFVSGGVLAFIPAADATYKVLVEFKANEESPQLRWNVETSVDGTGGRVTPSGTTQTQDGQVATFTFMNDEGYKLKSVLVQTTQADSFTGVEAQNMTNMVTNKQLQLTINANTRVVAAFESTTSTDPVEPQKNTFTVATSAEGGGTVSPSTPQTLYVDSSLTMTFKANSGWELAKVDVTCENPALSFSPKVTDMTEDNGTYSYRFGLPSTMDANSFAGKTVNVKATFQKVAVDYTVTVQTQGPGEQEPVATSQNATYGYVSPGYNDGGAVQVANGASQTFYFIEKPGYVVDGVYVGSQRVAGSVQSYQLVGVTADTTLRVVYAAQQSSGGTDEDELVDVQARVSGGNGAISPTEARVPEGGSVVFSLVPADGYQVASLTVDGVDQTAQLDGNAYTFAPVGKLAGGAAHQVVATFKRDTGGGNEGGDVRPPATEKELRHVFVRVTGEGSGMVTPGNVRTGDPQGTVDVIDGGQQTFSFLPDEGETDGMINVLDYIEIQRGGLTNRVENAGGSYTLFNLKSDVTLIVAFKQVKKGGPDDNKPTYARYTVAARATEGGTIDPAGDTVVNAGASLTLRAVADAGFHLSYFAIEGAADGSVAYVPAANMVDGCYTLANIQANHSVRAVFAADGSAGEEGFTAYTIDLDGTLVRASLTGIVNVKEGASQTLVLSPTFGNQIVGVRIVSAADPARVLWQTSVTGDASRQPVNVPLTYYAGVKGAVVLVDFGPGYGGDDPSQPGQTMYTVTTSVAADADGNRLGTITPGGTQQLPAGSNVTFTMVPFAGCTVDSVTANGNPVVFTTTGGYYQFTATDLSGALNVVAKFRKVAEGENVPTPGKTAQVTFDVQGAGSIQPDSPALVKPGDDLTITLVPKNGAKLGTLTVDGRDVTAQVQQMANGSYIYTIQNVTADTKVSATFVNADGTVGDTTNDLNVNVKVEVKVSGNVYGGTVDPNRTLTLTPGASQLFLIKPADGFYVAGAQVEYADGSSVAAKVLPWQPDYSGTARASVAGGTVSQTDQTAQVSSIGGTAAQAGTVQKPYSYVQVDNIRQSFVLHVTLDDCLKDPANTSKDRYLYTDAANSLVTTNPDVSGNGTVTPGDNTDVVGPGGDKTLIITPGTKPDGSLEDLDSITIHGVTIDLTGDDVRDASGKQVPELVVQKVKDYTVDGKPVLRPGEDFKWVPTPAPGHYELTLKAEQDENGKWVIDQPTINFGGAGPAFTNQVLLRAFEIDEDTGNRVPVDGAVLRLKATRLEDGKTAINEPIQLAYGGAVRVEAELLSDAYELVGIEADATGMLTPTPRTARSADTETQVAAPNTFYAYGPGSILALVQKKAVTNPDDPDNPDDPQGSFYTVEATAGKGGSISAAKESYKVGEQAQFTLTPDAGYQVASVTLNGQKSAYTSRTYTVPSELCVKDAHVKVHVEFTAAAAAAGDPQTSAAKKALRSLQSLATTGDNGAPLATTLLAVAFGALGIAVLIASRRRKANADHANALDE